MGVGIAVCSGLVTGGTPLAGTLFGGAFAAVFVGSGGVLLVGMPGIATTPGAALPAMSAGAVTLAGLPATATTAVAGVVASAPPHASAEIMRDVDEITPTAWAHADHSGFTHEL